MSRSAAEYKADDYSLLLFQDDDWLIVQIHTNQEQFHPFELERFLSALQFILSEHIHWVMCYKHVKNNHELAFRPFLENYSKSKYLKPLQFDSFDTDKAWDLFNIYLKHILLNKKDRNDKITRIISECVSAGSGSFKAFSLTVTLAIEEILNNCFQELSIETSVKKEDINLLKSDIKELEIEKKFKDRIYSFLGYVQKTGATDKLRHLIDKTSIKKSDYDDWKTLRNHYVHPNESKLSPQKEIDKTYSNLTLLHKLIFIKINYEGSYSNYSKTNWPKENF